MGSLCPCRHRANAAGSAPNGRVVVIAGDDHSQVLGAAASDLSPPNRRANFNAGLEPFHFVGGGNFHLVVLVDPDNAKDMEEAEWINERVVERALAMEGTCTGEHGTGMGKTRFMVREHGEGAVEVMRALKSALDPDNLLNPGKILP